MKYKTTLNDYCKKHFHKILKIPESYVKGDFSKVRIMIGAV